MEVVKVLREDGKERYYVEDNKGEAVDPILKFIRFKDNTNFARNTLKAYCQHLKLYFEYLEQRGLDFQQVTIDDLSLFVNWLQNPYQSLKVTPMTPKESARSPRTINIIVNTVLQFYDYILRYEEYSNNVSERLKKFVTVPSRNFKGFLYGIAYEKKKITSNILKLKVSRSKPKTLSKDQISMLIRTCTNYRDQFLLMLLWETGIRIGEALSLWVEDFDVSELTIDLKDRGELENNAEIKTVSSPRRIDISQNLANMFMEYIAEYHTEEVKTNHVFIKLIGENKNKPMNYVDVDNLFRTLEKKTGIHVTPHMFRHTSLTTLRMVTLGRKASHGEKH
ncbi:tyrosine-type recombinase/integrase [Clostridium sp. LBM24168]